MLSGLKVIEFEGLGPAPFAGMMLADLGADVIVIHRETADKSPGLMPAIICWIAANARSF